MLADRPAASQPQPLLAAMPDFWGPCFQSALHESFSGLQIPPSAASSFCCPLALDLQKGNAVSALLILLTCAANLAVTLGFFCSEQCWTILSRNLKLQPPSDLSASCVTQEGDWSFFIILDRLSAHCQELKSDEPISLQFKRKLKHRA